jgi:archaellum component FlaC
MPLTDAEQRKMYDMVKKTDWTLDAIMGRLEKGDKRLDNCDDRMDRSSDKLGNLEGELKLLKGKLGFVVVILSVCFTAALHAVGWIISLFGGKS